MAVEEAHGSGWKSTPGFAKFLILTQTIVILYFSYWAVSEYNNNYYFQSYLNSQFQGGTGSSIILGTVGIFSLVSLVLFVKLHKTHKELGEIIAIEAKGQTVAEHAKRQAGGLDESTERHLIEMIRRKASADNAVQSATEHPISARTLRENPAPASSVVGSPLPVLKRVDQSGRER
ncbi:hypothetical protein E6H29_03055 [Candidatus Bathyarchaeota archaeon]|nr:MAG: hypothetical protein AUJ07_04690 [Crenarchaeota archaeon 13_1_40CM_3_53_5]TMI32020.1 MAG: hypothetical protein E6H29_03055 [Candidatus Bathyarchaeota archaeon]